MEYTLQLAVDQCPGDPYVVAFVIVSHPERSFSERLHTIGLWGLNGYRFPTELEIRAFKEMYPDETPKLTAQGYFAFVKISDLERGDDSYWKGIEKLEAASVEF
jgi:hypothetical protein